MWDASCIKFLVFYYILKTKFTGICFLVIFVIAVQDMLNAKVQAQVQAQLGGIPVKT